MKIAASIEARMGSSRLPGKVLREIHGVPALTRLVRRLRRSKEIHEIVLATTISSKDDALEAWAKKENVKCFRGSEEDVLGRVCAAHAMLGSDIIVEVTGDAVLLDPCVIDAGIKTYKEKNVDVVTNVWQPGYPQGIDVQVFSRALLQDVADRISDPAVREHVSLYFYENPDRYKIHHMLPPKHLNRPNLRTQLDYEEDYHFISAVYSHLEPQYGDAFGIEEVISLLNEHPEIWDLNRNREEKGVR